MQERTGLDFIKCFVYNRLNTLLAERDMKKRTRSILEELSTLGTKRNTELLVENRGASIIESAVNLLNLVKQQFNEEEAQELERRFLNAIRAGDPRKFRRGVHRIQEARRNNKNTPE
jgi:hypothetical protein